MPSKHAFSRLIPVFTHRKITLRHFLAASEALTDPRPSHVIIHLTSSFSIPRSPQSVTIPLPGIKDPQVLPPILPHTFPHPITFFPSLFTRNLNEPTKFAASQRNSSTLWLQKLHLYYHRAPRRQRSNVAPCHFLVGWPAFWSIDRYTHNHKVCEGGSSQAGSPSS
ncbi:hypothetical protein M408DRAFT_100968 [Serendipita vermifera MAFF 305830]|uniref:Uncharacterized protein n=1 Tax=Serendipita vermifera MAFF 305830 TaxID=933852 RepID=A0A0C3BF91_SERVB|nr:hypothetical protein M408DRAFT_100968 [Serendipita vermifera MAFF 305830]